ncbi:MAG: arginyltransferase [Alphaproteobacteria bacterium]|nr:arginyltransferase [Alphaproteobacteria bacterium]MBT4711792.1 arginyltransferase [Alphaproteobacteria bacterium]
MTGPDKILHRFFATPAGPCPYLEDRVERKLFTPLVGRNAGRLHEALASSGFRRSQSIVYKPACEDCHACIPVRVRVEDFIATKSLRRIANRNKDLVTHECPPIATGEQYHLFHHYQKSRHQDSGMASMDFGEFQDMVEDTAVPTRMVEFRNGDGRLVATCLTDQMTDGLSLCYSFFDPTESIRSLGSFMVLWHIQHAAKLGLSYVHLGYWIAESPKMSYKTRFQPLEGLRMAAQGWRDLDEIVDSPGDF